MGDILSQGGRDRGRHWPRWVAALAVLVLATVLIVEHLPAGTANVPRHPSAPGPAAAVTLVPLPDQANGADGVSGLAMPRDASLRLPAGGQQPFWLWPATGRVQAIRGLPRDSAGYQFIRVTGGWAVQATSGARLRCGSCAGARVPVYFLADDAAAVTLAGTADSVAPAAAAGAVWLTSFPPGASISSAAGFAQEVSVAGAPLGARLRCGTCAGPRLPVYFLADDARSVTPAGAANEVAPGAAAGALWLTSYPAGADMSTASGTAREINVATGAAGAVVTLPAGYAIDQGTDHGLLLAPAAPTGTATYELWNPGTPHAVSRIFAGVLAASASQVAWATRCDPVCGVEVLDLATGRHTVVRLPGASSAVNGAFSPDGKFLTLQASFDNLGDDGALAMQLDVVSTASGDPAVLPLMRVSSDALVGFGWPGGGDDLVTELNFMAKLQIVAWRSGAHGLSVAAISPGPESDSLVVG